MADTMFVKIKKKYAAEILKDLEKLNAVELLDEAPIPDWQKKEVKKRFKELKKDPSLGVSWEDAKERIKQLSK